MCDQSSDNDCCVFPPPQRPEPIKEHVVKSHSEGIAMLAWSPDDTLLLSCGKEDNQEAMVYSTQVRNYQ